MKDEYDFSKAIRGAILPGPRSNRRMTRPGASLREHDFYCDEVLSGRLNVRRVFETAEALAFHHTRPAYEHHLVVIPKRHVPSLIDLGHADESLLAEVVRVVQLVARNLTEHHGACRVITNLGHFQESKHLHFHVVSGDRIDNDAAAG